MALSGLDIYKLLPKTNCRECGVATCLAFAMQLAKKAVSIDKCPYTSEQSKQTLSEASRPAIRLVSIGRAEAKFEVGNETVMFRHEEKFHRPTGLGFIIDDNLAPAQIKEKLAGIALLKFERIGQVLAPNLVAIRFNGDTKRYVDAVKVVAANTKLALVLMSEDPKAQEEALKVVASSRPLIWGGSVKTLADFARLAKEYKVPLVISSDDLDSLSAMTRELNAAGVEDIILDTKSLSMPAKIWELTQIRRQALKKSNRALGYPILAVAENDDPAREVLAAAAYICKYAGIVLIKGTSPAEVLSLLTLRQSIYTDPQRPLQIEPKLYSIGNADEKSPVLVTTNFSLSYYTVLGEVEACKVPAYILPVDTEGMSVLTAWAAEKFTPAHIAKSLEAFGAREKLSPLRVVIPGYVAMMSGELEDTLKTEIIVGPKEATGIPAFLKNL